MGKTFTAIALSSAMVVAGAAGALAATLDFTALSTFTTGGATATKSGASGTFQGVAGHLRRRPSRSPTTSGLPQRVRCLATFRKTKTRVSTALQSLSVRVLRSKVMAWASEMTRSRTKPIST